MRFAETTISLQEIPSEICIAFTMTGCSLRCKGCHSSYLWDSSYGEELTYDVLDAQLDKYKFLVTCVLFMGGEWNKEFPNILAYVKLKGFKTALYTGLCDVSHAIKSNLDYLKTGPWIESLGGLDSEKTNQRLVRLTDGQLMNQLFRRKL